VALDGVPHEPVDASHEFRKTIISAVKFFMNSPQTLQELVELISNELGSNKGLTHADVDVDKISRWMSSYKSNPEDWEKYALW
jgi:hypothetical protein